MLRNPSVYRHFLYTEGTHVLFLERANIAEINDAAPGALIWCTPLFLVFLPYVDTPLELRNNCST